MEYKTFKVVVVVLLFLLLLIDVFVPTNAHPLIIFGQAVCPYILKCPLVEAWMKVGLLHGFILGDG